MSYLFGRLTSLEICYLITFQWLWQEIGRYYNAKNTYEAGKPHAFCCCFDLAYEFSNLVKKKWLPKSINSHVCIKVTESNHSLDIIILQNKALLIYCTCVSFYGAWLERRHFEQLFVDLADSSSTFDRQLWKRELATLWGWCTAFLKATVSVLGKEKNRNDPAHSFIINIQVYLDQCSKRVLYNLADTIHLIPT